MRGRRSAHRCPRRARRWSPTSMKESPRLLGLVGHLPRLSSKAVEVPPGGADLVQLESRTTAQGTVPAIDLRALILRPDREAT